MSSDETIYTCAPPFIPNIQISGATQMNDIEKKALALVNEVAAERGTEYPCVDRRNDARWEALCRAIEQHEAIKQEVERLNGLITATADHWLTLQVKHPIQWEGAINSAMAAACAEIEKHEAFKQKVSDAIVEAFGDGVHPSIEEPLRRFIIPAPKPDPLLAAMLQIGVMPNAAALRAALDTLGFEIRSKANEQ